MFRVIFALQQHLKKKVVMLVFDTTLGHLLLLYLQNMKVDIFKLVMHFS